MSDKVARALSGLPTLDDAELTERASMLPLGRYTTPEGFTYTDLAWPQWVVDAVTLPGRAWEGKVAPDQMIPEAFNFAGAVTTGGFASPKPRGAIGSAGGKPPAPEGIRAYHGSPHDFASQGEAEAAPSPVVRALMERYAR